ncbi:toprim domain-containing protein [Embleya hyalina]|uniref:toprim domain-containing protein n=1 Tax=Embleya hyalina TaxID=516124 RepID=UPI003530CDC7
MRARGLDKVAGAFGLGYVGSALTGHERQRGRLAVPYVRPAGGTDAVATVRFRCIRDACVKHDGRFRFPGPEKHEGHSKYDSQPGDPHRIFNTWALVRRSNHIALCEGEMDAMAMQAAGVPAIGIQGVSAWKPFFVPALRGFESVFLMADDDEPGLKFADKLAAQLPNAKVIVLGGGHDVNGYLHARGEAALRARLGLREDTPTQGSGQ